MKQVRTDSFPALPHIKANDEHAEGGTSDSERQTSVVNSAPARLVLRKTRPQNLQSLSKLWSRAILSFQTSCSKIEKQIKDSLRV